MDINKDLVKWFTDFMIKMERNIEIKSKAAVICAALHADIANTTEPNQQLADELQKPIIKKFQKQCIFIFLWITVGMLSCLLLIQLIQLHQVSNYLMNCTNQSLESFKKITIHLFMDYSRAANFADMQRRSRYNNTLFCCVLLIFSVNMHQYLSYSFYR